MKKDIACLILVHKNIYQVLRLCNSLRHESVKIFVHLDKKMKVSDEERRMLQESSENLYVIPERMSCFLDEWSLVKATMALITNAREILRDNVGYYILMSGQDYLIKPVAELVEFLQINYPRPFIDCTPRSTSNWVYEKFAHTKLRIFARKLRRIIGVRGFLFISLYLEKIVPKKSVIYNKLRRFRIPLYGGSAWWALPDKAIDEITGFYLNKKEFIDEYKWSDTPEETFFQTIIMQTSIADYVIINDPDERAQNCLTYANFETPTKEFVGHPHVIRAEDYSWLVEKEQYIARKFDLDIDSSIFDKLDQYVLNIKR